MRSAAPAVGLRRAQVQRAQLIRPLSTVVFRVDDLAVKVYPPTASLSRLAAVLAALPARSPDLLLPSSGLVATPDGAVTCYPWLERGAEASWPEIGALLAAFHATADVDPSLLPPWAPLARTDEQLAAYAGRPEYDAGVARVVRDAADRLVAAAGDLASDLGWGLIHGDVSAENVLRDSCGRCVFIDIDWVARGPREYDLVSAALRRERGEIDEGTYDTFCAAYGHDVRAWSGLAVVEDICELGGLTFRLWSESLRGASLDWIPDAVRRWT